MIQWLLLSATICQYTCPGDSKRHSELVHRPFNILTSYKQLCFLIERLFISSSSLRPVTSRSFTKICFFLFMLNIVSSPPNEILWGVYPALPPEYLESVPSTHTVENLSRRKSSWLLALVTEAILMFYWFFDLFFSCPTSIYTLSLYLRHKYQAKRPQWVSILASMFPYAAFVNVLIIISGGVWFGLTSSFEQQSEILPFTHTLNSFAFSFFVCFSK